MWGGTFIAWDPTVAAGFPSIMTFMLQLLMIVPTKG
jgi:hypothetical protein